MIVIVDCQCTPTRESGMSMDRFDYDDSDIHVSYDAARALPRDTVRLWMDETAAAIGAAGDGPAVTRIVDLGCGTGRFCVPLHRKFGAPVVGVDPSENMLGVARESIRDPDITFVQGRADNIPVEPGVSLLFMSMCFHYFQNEISTVLPEFTRVVEPGGFVVVRNTTREDIDLLPMFDFFEDARRSSLERMPSGESLELALAPAFELIAKKRVIQRYAENGEEYLAKIGERGLSSLKMLSDDAFEAGMSRLRSHIDSTTDIDDLLLEGISLFVFRKR
jgi:ubiquinone/menaquinone biosynthesis C-methylase UbiE